MAKNEYVSITSPKGMAIYPWLNTPDTKFNPAGEYKVNLAVEASEATPLTEKIDEAFEQAKSLIPEGKKVKEADLPYFDELDDDQQKTGRVVFKFKMKAEVKTKDGRTIEMQPRLFDASGSLITNAKSESIWGGSILRVSADLIPFYVAAVGAGVSIRMKAVQVIELVTGKGADASSYGFDETEGYSAPSQGEENTDFNDDEDF